VSRRTSSCLVYGSSLLSVFAEHTIIQTRVECQPNFGRPIGVDANDCVARRLQVDDGFGPSGMELVYVWASIHRPGLMVCHLPYREPGPCPARGLRLNYTDIMAQKSQSASRIRRASPGVYAGVYRIKLLCGGCRKFVHVRAATTEVSDLCCLVMLGGQGNSPLS
jgi:hypothetical protein